MTTTQNTSDNNRVKQMLVANKIPYFTQNHPITLQKLARIGRGQGLETEKGLQPQPEDVTFFTREELLRASLEKFLVGRSIYNEDFAAQEAVSYYEDLVGRLQKSEQDGELGLLDKPLYSWIEGFYKHAETALLERSVLDKSKLDPANFIPDFGAILVLLRNSINASDLQTGNESAFRRVVEQDLLLTLIHSSFEPLYELFQEGEPLQELYSYLESEVFSNPVILVRELPEIVDTFRGVRQLPLFATYLKEGSASSQDAGDLSNFVDTLSFLDANSNYFGYVREMKKTSPIPDEEALLTIYEKITKGEEPPLKDYACSTALRDFLIALWELRGAFMQLNSFIKTLSALKIIEGKEVNVDAIYKQANKGTQFLYENVEKIRDCLSHVETVSEILTTGKA